MNRVDQDSKNVEKAWKIVSLLHLAFYPEKQENDKKALQRKVKRARKFYVAGREKK